MDRNYCDSCGLRTRAAVVFWHSESKAELAFCGHHSNKFEKTLFGKGWSITKDDRSKETPLLIPVNETGTTEPEPMPL